ncbi:MAG TPA: hypothetical protein DDW50_07135 [Firmicutes bacterium]|nr:hypothetical protein [Bacillota bacterium]
MPIYEFKCLACNHEFEELCRTGENAKCPKCSSMDTKKKLSLFSAKSVGGNGSQTISSSSHSCASCHGGSCGTCH